MTKRPKEFPILLKQYRGCIKDDLWKKLMALFVHGEEEMSLDILCETLISEEYILSKKEKLYFIKAAKDMNLISDDLPNLKSLLSYSGSRNMK